jgi:nucleotide-binding universal stress UspA family protein
VQPTSSDFAYWRFNANNPGTFTQPLFKNILFATDFSSTAERALPYAVELARRFGCAVHTVHVIQPDIYPLVPPSEWPKMAQEEEEFRNEKRRRLEDQLLGLPHEFRFPTGNVWQNLARIIEDQDIDLIVVGTLGRAGIEKVMMGSTAETIFRQASCPVLTVGPGVISKATHAAASELNRILYATDFSAESLAGARHAISLAKEYRAELILMHSINNSDPGQINSAFQTLRDVVPFGAALTLRPRFIVEQGRPEETILGIAERHNADMIVLGVRSVQQYVAAATHFTGSIAYRVVTHAACPVLTVRS